MKHIHQYHRVDIGRKLPYFVMKCALPQCPHYIAMKTKLSCPALVGEISICNTCHQQFELDRRALRQAKPICVDCIKSPHKEKFESAADFFANLEKGLGKE